VSVAHVMEDCFVAAQQGKLSLTARDVDVLLRGVDLLGRISSATKDPNLDLNQEFGGLVDAQVAELHGVLSGRPSPVETAPAHVARPDASSSIGESPHQPVSTTVEAGLPAPEVPDITITFPAYLDSAASEELRQQLLAAIDSPSRTICLDLHSTRDLDADGLAFLAAVPPYLARSGHPAPELSRVSPELATVLRVTGLAGSFGGRRESAWGAE
ncbi:STAS domain-containing protein, partial [Singulisphaera rosea]